MINYKTNKTEIGFEATCDEYPTLKGFGFDIDVAIADLKSQIILEISEKIMDTHSELFKRLAKWEKENNLSSERIEEK